MFGGATCACCVLAFSLQPQVPPGDLQLVLQGAAAGGRNLTFRSSSGSSNCSSWDFTVQPNSTAQPGSFAAHLVLPKQRVSLRLPRRIAVEVPLLLSMRSQSVNASADTSAFAVRVQLNAPAGPGGVTVRLQLMNDAGAVRVRLQEDDAYVQALQQQRITGSISSVLAICSCLLHMYTVFLIVQWSRDRTA
jgi:hypothetical protein